MIAFRCKSNNTREEPDGVGLSYLMGKWVDSKGFCRCWHGTLPEGFWQVKHPGRYKSQNIGCAWLVHQEKLGPGGIPNQLTQLSASNLVVKLPPYTAQRTSQMHFGILKPRSGVCRSDLFEQSRWWFEDRDAKVTGQGRCAKNILPFKISVWGRCRIMVSRVSYNRRVAATMQKLFDITLCTLLKRPQYHLSLIVTQAHARGSGYRMTERSQAGQTMGLVYLKDNYLVGDGGVADVSIFIWHPFLY